ncbi:type II toxin-antitoxin system VapC family toxin [Saccharolobus solfataricus]|uniref:PIN domain-containing protein n=3 Tax=Saccharolobus solfataricus TaxID=2287 RepID=Q97V51_SACS2|nr:PIN domain-containing protein [Saccharolobus solfataricus]AAK42894.1 Hypothetical protein SSO2783 [Saccharolobus solfataricus P2]AKA72987.1 type II toxin-antitoxin system VapC family toxin [Saccharolobus solfataricus]AKA75686.1 type II toxin-antitoxin system VapC family toxin [Saccharolobus solfataricus]AKA78378.1 type II toxin-antitoxin system VapC family toxin [Saccharolobus solfataricus]AZF67498.1 type II toxin-antitoxin system VapC family toxin [Saccharolobus solfataricus]
MDEIKYVDTNVILSLVEEDANFERARKLKGLTNLVTGEITQLELNSFYSRKLKDEIKARASTLYLLQFVNVKVIEADWNKLFRKALDLSYKLELKTLDVLQIASAFLSGSKIFITFDKEIISKREIVKKYTGVSVDDLT